jgi:hypothetical protein
MPKYIEELLPGQCFCVNNQQYIITSDFDNKSKRLCIDLKTGQSRWFKFDTSTDTISIYILDDNSNFSPINPEPANVSIKNNNFS